MQTFSNNVVIVLNVDNANRHDLLSAFNFFEEKRIKIPVILKGSYQSSDFEKVAIDASIDIGSILLEGMGNGIWIQTKDFDSKIISPEKIFGGNTIEQAASIFLDVLNLRSTKEQTDVVLANSALAISTAKEIGISEGFDLAKDSLLSKKALKSFNTLIELSK